MMGTSEVLAPPTPLRAIKIDPEQRSVELIEIASDEVAGILRSELTETVDFEEGHCLVIDDGGHTADHPSRFRFSDGPLLRPFFGPGLVFGLDCGNWAAATMQVQQIKAMIIWEIWDEGTQQYALPAAKPLTKSTSERTGERSATPSRARRPQKTKPRRVGASQFSDR